MHIESTAIIVADYDEAIRFFVDVLGFRVAEEADLGGVSAVWLTCSNKAHDIAFVPNPDPASFHHVAPVHD